MSFALHTDCESKRIRRGAPCHCHLLVGREDAYARGPEDEEGWNEDDRGVELKREEARK